MLEMLLVLVAFKPTGHRNEIVRFLYGGDKREANVEAAFAALQNEIPAYPPRCLSMLEALCVEDQHVPEVWLPEVRWMLERIAKAARMPGQKDDKRRGRGRPG
jgi:hypothetical protein